MGLNENHLHAFAPVKNPPSPVPKGLFAAPADQSGLESPSPHHQSSFHPAALPFWPLTALCSSPASEGPFGVVGLRGPLFVAECFLRLTSPDPQQIIVVGFRDWVGTRREGATGTLPAWGGNLHYGVNNIKRERGQDRRSRRKLQHFFPEKPSMRMSAIRTAACMRRFPWELSGSWLMGSPRTLSGNKWSFYAQAHRWSEDHLTFPITTKEHIHPLVNTQS